MAKQKFALVSDQGTSCSETCLCSEHYTEQNRNLIESSTATGHDQPILGTWTDVTENDACNCVLC